MMSTANTTTAAGTGTTGPGLRNLVCIVVVGALAMTIACTTAIANACEEDIDCDSRICRNGSCATSGEGSTTSSSSGSTGKTSTSSSGSTGTTSSSGSTSTPKYECTGNSQCGSCERCSDHRCRACGSGPYGCYC